MANGHGLFETVQQIYEEGNVPSSVTNRLIMAALISERKERLERDAEIQNVLKDHCDDIEHLKLNDKRWGGFSTSLAAIGTLIAAIIGANN